MFQVIIELMLIGLGLWAINTYVPMAQPIKTILNVVVVVLVVLWLLSLFGLFSGPIGNIPQFRRSP
jgi:hypothetical protein